MTRHSSSYAPTWIRAVLLGLLLLAGHIAGPLHEAHVRHVICPEHGELLHESVTAPAASIVRYASEHARGVVLPSRPAAGHGHDVCQLPASLRTGSVRVATLTCERVLVACVPTSVPRPSERRWDSVPRLRLAPKQSPPELA